MFNVELYLQTGHHLKYEIITEKGTESGIKTCTYIYFIMYSWILSIDKGKKYFLNFFYFYFNLSLVSGCSVSLVFATSVHTKSRALKYFLCTSEIGDEGKFVKKKTNNPRLYSLFWPFFYTQTHTCFHCWWLYTWFDIQVRPACVSSSIYMLTNAKSLRETITKEKKHSKHTATKTWQCNLLTLKIKHFFSFFLVKNRINYV